MLLAAHPTRVEVQGRHEFDGQLPDWSAEGKAEKGGRKAWRDFHDQFLSCGGPPVSLFRSQMVSGN
jgi:hypothetical protein